MRHDNAAGDPFVRKFDRKEIYIYHFSNYVSQ